MKTKFVKETDRKGTYIIEGSSDGRFFNIKRFICQVWGIERSGFFNGREKWAKGFENQRV
ncbi:hypothetical protein K0G69_06230 [Bacteroides fragilis]|nr:hypothetical protein [Bacteroides fragilis]MCE9281172.1 hypothetical protein [Bacteroides fragilis]